MGMFWSVLLGGLMVLAGSGLALGAALLRTPGGRRGLLARDRRHLIGRFPMRLLLHGKAAARTYPL